MLSSELVMVKFLAVLNLLPVGLATEFSARPTNTSARVGESVTLRCGVGGFDGAVPLKVQWAREGFVFVEGSDRSVSPYAHMAMVGDELAGEYHLQIRDVQVGDNGEYECQVGPREEVPYGLRAKAHLTVLVPPSNMSLSGPDGVRDGGRLEVQEGSTVQVQCTTTGSRPRPTIAWYKGGKRVGEGVEMEEEVGEQGLVTATSTLSMTALGTDDDLAIVCHAVHPALDSAADMRAEFHLGVLYAPGVPVIRGHDDGSVLEAGQRLKLTCEAEQGNPPASLVWLRNGRRIDQDFLHQGRLTLNHYDFTVAPEDNDAEFRCEASNSLADPPLSSSLRLSVHYAPKSAEIQGPRAVRAGGTVGLKCVSEASHPAAKIHWVVQGADYRDSTLIIRPVAGGGTVSTSNITLRVPLEARSAWDVRCVAKNEAMSKSASALLSLGVHYPPDSLEVLGYSGQPLVAGHAHTLTCIANGGSPSPKLTWFRRNKKITENIRSEMEGSSVTGSELRLSLRPSDNGAAYRCEATSPALTEPLRAETNLSVHFAPAAVSVEEEPADGDSVFRAGKIGYLTCQSQPSNPAPRLRWSLDGQTLPSTDVHNASSAHGGWVVRNKLHLALSADMDGSSYVCTAENEALGKAASKGHTLDVRYPPQFALDLPQSLTVLENETLSLNYTVDAKPSRVAFAWYKDGTAITDGRVESGAAHSALAWRSVSRADSGVYSLVASNEEGKRNLSTNVTVTFPATVVYVKSPVVVEIGARAELPCYVAARPAPISLKWVREGFDFGVEGVNQTIRGLRPDELVGQIEDSLRSSVSVLTIRFSSSWTGLSGQFLCKANNGLGESERKATFLVKSPPKIPLDSRTFRAAGVEGREGRLRCLATGVPEVQFTWHRPGSTPGTWTPIAADGRKFEVYERKAGLFSYESELLVRGVKAEDFGSYKCSAANEKGRDEVVVELEKAGPPSPPHAVFAHNVTRDSVTVSWSPGFDGGLPQTFTILYRLLGSDLSKAQRLKVPPGAQDGAHSFRVKGLRPRTKYEFSVGAENSEGFTKFPQEPHVVAETLGSGSLGVLGRGLEEGLPTMVIILIVLVSVLLLLLNVCLVLCLIRRQKRKKLKVHKQKQVTIQSPEKAASARLMEAGGPRPVQMFGCEAGQTDGGLRPDSQYTTVGTDSGDAHNGSSEDDGSLRGVLERGQDGHVYLAERISPGSQQTYLVDDPYQALVPHAQAHAHLAQAQHPSYADQLRAANASLQRRTAGGGTLGRADGSMGRHSSLNYAAIQPDYPSTFSPSYDSEAPAILSAAPALSAAETSVLSTSAELPPAMGPLRHLADDRDRDSLPHSLRRYSPQDERLDSVVSAGGHGGPYVAEVRPILSTFGHPAPRAHPEYADLDHGPGDLV